ncbi:unnamed protein product [Xylocopa violacea]|uniref:Uncharacterized protein n=1 Tax=Xylocopa violacea TaxID=135666 RepID=A0ABP1P0N1_XYLVO
MNSYNDNSSKPRGHISVTPEMIVATIKRLQLRKLYVPFNLISEYLQHSYPVENNLKEFSKELQKKLNCAVHVGLILKHGENSYYLPTLRQKANALKTAFSEFWEIYKSCSRLCASQIQNGSKNYSRFKNRNKSTKYSKNNIYFNDI